MSKDNLKLPSLQFGRAAAAISVVLYHVTLIFSDQNYGSQILFPSATQYGILGVNFFFVTSGFIILKSHFDDISKPSRVSRYIWRRIVRIYPIYWIYLSLYIIASATGLGHSDFSWNIDQLFNSILLVQIFPQHAPLPLKVAWTLFYEVQFYLIFIPLLLSKWVGLSVMLLWVLAIIANYAFGYSDLAIFSIWNIHFILGMISYLAFRKLPDGIGSVPLLAGIIGIGYFVYSQIGGGVSIKELREPQLPMLAVSFGLLLLGMVLLDRDGRFRVPRALQFMGDASYSIYLVHSAIISVVALLASRLHLIALGGDFFWFGAAALAATLGGALAYAVLERPILAELRSRLRGP